MRSKYKQHMKDSLTALVAIGTGIYITLPHNPLRQEDLQEITRPVIETPYVKQEVPQSLSLDEMIVHNLRALPQVPENPKYTDPNEANHPLYQITNPELQLTPNFKVKEFVTSGGRVQEYARISPDIVLAMQQLRDTLGQPIVITSGYRCPERNEAVGGSSKSRHMSGDAVDIDVKGMSPQALSEKVIEVLGEDIGLHTYADGHVHVDLRGYKARW